ncbi:hypothetical protein AOL_s00006g592 [Orbilia oligospora ATCC 24927]|uniref:Uncharacterized protein n=1 Tax=Arthrobotrys oligospora (strain ATCC 24927 / CBS 115.81 / DSM 1491) TaxID=756982 RepID=G1X141_ARTOA|nr:hypothetical protein AOL_s00006g592 [Orbilia oligospora ATCC 24927]EGX53214.1 hypothetical protein AOL_s00006g592 [Orbilia oligospora ATCC 24927]
MPIKERDHVVKSGKCIADNDQVHIFLREHFIHWLDVMSLLGGAFEIIYMFVNLQSKVDASCEWGKFYQALAGYKTVHPSKQVVNQQGASANTFLSCSLLTGVEYCKRAIQTTLGPEILRGPA